MAHAFQQAYSTYYDLLYRDKDYPAEARFVADVIRRFVNAVPGLRLLDVACGTGRHAVELAGLGFDVAGCDQSEGMLERARENLARAGVRGSLHHVPFQKIGSIKERFDAVTSMFSAVNYLTTYPDLSQALTGIAQVLRPGGVFLFDFWNGNAVLDHYSPVRVKEVQNGARRLLRTSETTLDPVRHLARVHYHVVLFEGDRVAAEFREDHVVRYYFPQEMADALAIHDFELVHACPFLEPDRAIAPLDWNLTYVARPRRASV
jgi:SAM-dependent methyltransferase